MRVGQRHDQQHGRDAGMCGPGDTGRDHDTKYGIGGHGIHENADARRILGGRQRIQQDVQRQQHQAEADQHAADILDPRARPGAESDEAEDEENGRDRGDVEREHLNNERGADIGAQHDGKCRHEADQTFRRERARDQRSRSAALQDRGEADAGGERLEAIAQRLRQQPPQVGAERAQDAAVDHVQAPQQQRHAAHQVEKYEASHDCRFRT